MPNHLNRWRDGQQWLSEDPEGFGAGDSNLMRLTGNDPINSTDPTGLDRIYIRDGQVYWQPQRTKCTSWLGYEVGEDVGEAIEIGRLDADTVLLDKKGEWSSRRGNHNSFNLGIVKLRELNNMAAQTNRYWGTASRGTVERNIDADITALHGGGALNTSAATGAAEGASRGAAVTVDAATLGRINEIHALSVQYQLEAVEEGDVVTQ